ncbi:MAG: DapH/DapD/GlmU-related protein [archaeon]
MTEKPEELMLDYYFDDMDACPCKAAFENIDYIWDALKNKKHLLDLKESVIHGKLDETVKIIGHVKIGKGTVIESNVVIEGPVIIGENVTIRPNALIRPGCIIGNEVVIGHSTEVKNVIAFNEVKMASHTFVGDTILGKGARIGSGTIIGNRRFDQKTAKVRIKDHVIDVGVEKYGGIIGEYVRLGANCSTSPGMMIGKHTWVYAGVLVQGFIPKESLVKLRQAIEIVHKDKMELSRTDDEGHI